MKNSLLFSGRPVLQQAENRPLQKTIREYRRAKNTVIMMEEPVHDVKNSSIADATILHRKETDMELKAGMKNSITINVTAAMCADNLDSQLPQVDLPHVFSTPSMINLMELTCADLLAKNLEEGKGSVGMAVEVKHFSATPEGGRVTCEVEIAEIDGKKILFNVAASDEKGPIGKGTHKRAIITKK